MHPKLTTCTASLALALAATALAERPSEGSPPEGLVITEGNVALFASASWPTGRDIEPLLFPIGFAGASGSGGAGGTNQRWDVSCKANFSIAASNGQVPTLALSALAADMNHCEHQRCQAWASVGTLDRPHGATSIGFKIDKEYILEVEEAKDGSASWSINASSGLLISAGDTLHLMPGTYDFDFEVSTKLGDASLDVVLKLLPAMEGDFDGDGIVSASDLNLLLAEWGPHACGATTDLTHDCQVDVNDVFALLSIWSTAADE